MCLKHLDLDIIGIAETHLTGSDVLEVQDYQWFGSNRQHIHVRARTGSGGVGFLIHNDICSIFDITVVNNANEGILWLKLLHKFDSSVIYPCVCYLPPENSSRSVDVHNYFDTLLTDIYIAIRMMALFIFAEILTVDVVILLIILLVLIN